MNKIADEVLKCCYRNVCSNDDIQILLKLTKEQFDKAVAILVLRKYVTKTSEAINITPAGMLYIETMRRLK